MTDEKKPADKRPFYPTDPDAPIFGDDPAAPVYERPEESE